MGDSGVTRAPTLEEARACQDIKVLASVEHGAIIVSAMYGALLDSGAIYRPTPICRMCYGGMRSREDAVRDAEIICSLLRSVRNL